MGLAIQLMPTELSVDPGRMGTIKAHISNRGSETCEVAVELPTSERTWSWIHPESCPLAAGGEAIVTLFFKPAPAPHPSAGPHVIDIVARSAGETTNATATVTVGPFVDGAGSLEPMVAYGPMTATYAFHLANRGNVVLGASLRTEDPSGVLDIRVEPIQLTAGPGETATAVVSVQARKKLKRGQHAYRVCVLADIEGGSDLRIEGAFRQQGLKPAK